MLTQQVLPKEGSAPAVSRRNVVAASGLAVGAVALLACGPQAPSGAGSDEGAPLEKRKPVNLEFWGDPPTAGSSNQRTDQINAWNARYPNLQVTFGATKTTGQGLEAVAAITAAAAAGTPPHVVDFDRFQVATYAVKRMWQPLDEFVKKDKYELKKFVPAVLEEAMGFDKKLYGLPRSTDARMIYWNKESFQEAGLDPEKPPATWDELKQYAIRLTRRGGSTGLEKLGFHTEEGQSHYHIFAWQAGGSFQTSDGKKATLPTGPNQEALQWMTDLVKDLGGWPLLKGFRDTWGPGSSAQNAFLLGQLAMMYSTNGTAGGTIARYRPEMKFGVAQPPLKKAGEKPLTWSGGFSYVMSNGVKNADLGWELMKWLVSEDGWNAGYEGDAARAKAVGGIYAPGMTGQPDLDKKMYAKYKTGIEAVDKVPDVAVGLMHYTRFRELSIAAADLWDGVKKSQLQAISQDKSAKQALEDNNVAIQRALDEAWQNVPT